MLVFRVLLYPFPCPPFLSTHFRDSQIKDKMDVLSKDFEGTNPSFNLQDIVRTSNADWFNNVALKNDKQTAMKNVLRQGDVKTLNICTVGFNSDAARGLLSHLPC